MSEGLDGAGAAARDGAEKAAGLGGSSDGGFNDLFRAETAISWLDLRLDVGAKIERVTDTEDVELAEDRTVRVLGGLTQLRGSLDVTVGGDYTRETKDMDVFAVSSTAITEKVFANVLLHAQLESEAIMGGGYASQNIGLYARLAGMWDTMCWGGWSEVDANRAEIASASIRAHFYYVHRAGMRNLLAYHYIDDYSTRVEDFNNLEDQQTTVTEAGGPGSGVHSEM